jgi:diacylglycerol O-acyltransferase / wax synthase
MPDIEHLSSLDASFLHFESAETPMHVGSVHVLELPDGYAGDFYEDVKAHVAGRMHLAKAFTRKLARMPFDLSNPVWVEDDDIDIDYHVRHVVLPRPGTWAQLERLVARLHSQLLDRSRPLWEMTLIEGLETGECVFYTKTHHAGIDGQAGIALGRALLDLEPHPRLVRKPRPKLRRERYQLGIAELAGAAFGNATRQYVDLARALPGMARALKKLLVPVAGEDGKRRWLPEGGRLLAPRTPFNVVVTNQRSWAARTIPLVEAKATAKAYGSTLNDVVLAVCAGAMRRYLADYNALPSASMTAAVPVSLRADGDERANNQVGMMVMTLASDIADPIERLHVIAKASKKTKSSLGEALAAVPTDVPLLGAPWLMSGLSSLIGRSRLANVLPQPANVIVSNVSGSPVPLYIAGARLRSFYPVSIPTHGFALNITLNSYDGRLDFGFIACRRAVPDLGDLADYLVAEFRCLRDLALEPKAAPAVVPPARALIASTPVSGAARRARAAPKTPPEPATAQARKVRARHAAA